jgi:hypothetical protein
MRWWEIDLSALVIRGLRATRLVWDVVEISVERQATKLA